MLPVRHGGVVVLDGHSCGGSGLIRKDELAVELSEPRLPLGIGQTAKGVVLKERSKPLVQLFPTLPQQFVSVLRGRNAAGAGTEAMQDDIALGLNELSEFDQRVATGLDEFSLMDDMKSRWTKLLGEEVAERPEVAGDRGEKESLSHKGHPEI